MREPGGEDRNAGCPIQGIDIALCGIYNSSICPSRNTGRLYQGINTILRLQYRICEVLVEKKDVQFRTLTQRITPIICIYYHSVEMKFAPSRALPSIKKDQNFPKREFLIFFHVQIFRIHFPIIKAWK